MKEIQEIFLHRKVDLEKLFSYGFTKQENLYVYPVNIMNDDFRLDFYFDGKDFTRIYIYDNQWEDEYFDITNDSTYENVNYKVREEIEKILEDIKEKCFSISLFTSPQTNRLVSLIQKKWNISPDFPWNDENGVVRNPDNQKWFGLIMHIDAKRMKLESRMVDVLNVKIDPFQNEEILSRKGIYPAYHMNHKSWISIILDDTLSDEEVMSYMEWSYLSVLGEKKENQSAFLVPSNPSMFDIERELKETGSILWENRCHAKAGDVAYIYYGQPYSSIMLLCKIEKVGIENPFPTTAKSCMKLVLIKKFKEKELPLQELRNHGLTSVRCQRKISSSLLDYLKIFS